MRQETDTMMRSLMLVLATVVMACSHNPVKTALQAEPENRAETLAFALHNQYVVVAEEAARIAENPETPRSVKQALVKAHEVASPFAKQLREVALQYNNVKAALAAGTSTPEKAAIALAELNRVLLLAAPKMSALASEVNAAH